MAKHRQAALRLGLCRLVLQDVPMLSEAAVLDPDNVRGDPGDGPAGSREASVYDDVVRLRDDQLMLVTQGVGCAADQSEQPFATRFNVCAVLDVGVRPEPRGRRIVALVEQGVEGL